MQTASFSKGDKLEKLQDCARKELIKIEML